MRFWRWWLRPRHSGQRGFAAKARARQMVWKAWLHEVRCTSPCGSISSRQTAHSSLCAGRGQRRGQPGEESTIGPCPSRSYVPASCACSWPTTRHPPWVVPTVGLCHGVNGTGSWAAWRRAVRSANAATLKSDTTSCRVRPLASGRRWSAKASKCSCTTAGQCSRPSHLANIQAADQCSCSSASESLPTMSAQVNESSSGASLGTKMEPCGPATSTMRVCTDPGRGTTAAGKRSSKPSASATATQTHQEMVWPTGA